MAIIMGWLTDKLGPKRVVTVFGAFLGLSYFLLSQVHELWQFQLYYILFASIGLSTATVPVMATIIRWFSKKRGLMTAIVQSGTGIGGFVFAPFTGWLIINYGWRPAYFVLGLIGLVVIVAAGLTLRRNPKPGEIEKESAPDLVPNPVKRSNGLPYKGLTLHEAIRTKQFWVLAGLFFSFGFCRATFLPHIASHVQDIGFSLSDGANVLGVLTLASILGRFWLGWISNKLAFVVSFAVTTTALVWALFAHDLWALYIFAIVFGFGWGAQAVIRFIASSDAFGPLSIGLILGVLGFSEAGASAIGSYLAGYLFDISGSYQLAFLISIPISIAGIILAALIKPARRESI